MINGYYFKLLVLVCLLFGFQALIAGRFKDKTLEFRTFTCDSTGVVKSVFMRSEPIYVGFSLKNISNHPIIYDVDHSKHALFTACISKVDGEGVMGSLCCNPCETWDKNVLNPNDTLYKIQRRLEPQELKSGKYFASLIYFFHINQEYEDIFYNKSDIYFTVK